MINFRKMLCRSAKNGGWLYKICDCSRYEPAPTPVDPPKPIPVPKIPYVGTSCYQLIKYPMEDIVWFLRNVAANGGNMTEVFFVFTWDDGWKFGPHQLVDTRADVGSAYGEYKFPVFDLDKWDENVWNKWRQIFNLCRELGINLFVRIMDQCSLKDGFEKRHNPFRSNIQRLDKKTLTGGLYGSVIREYYDKLNWRLISELEYAGVQYHIVPWNEFDVILDGWTEDEGNQVAAENMWWWGGNLIDNGCAADRILISTSRSYDKIKEYGYRMEIHGVASPVSMMMARDKFGEHIFCSGDGPDVNAQGNAAKNGYREPSRAQAEDMGDMIYVPSDKWYGYGYYNRLIEAGVPSDIRRADFAPLAALAE